jgi:hypothetical protein
MGSEDLLYSRSKLTFTDFKNQKTDTNEEELHGNFTEHGRH